MITDLDVGFAKDITFYPIGIPNKTLVVHNECSTLMIGKVWNKRIDTI